MRRTLLVLVALLAVACGVPQDDEPRPIAAEALPEGVLEPENPEPTPDAGSDTTLTALIYLLDERGLLQSVAREIPLPGGPDELLASLVVGLNEEEIEDGALSTAIPAETEILGTSISDTTLTIDLGPQIRELAADQRLALGQIVYTLTVPATIDDVRVLVEGEPVSLPTDSGDNPEFRPVTRDDYRSLDPLFQDDG